MQAISTGEAVNQDLAFNLYQRLASGEYNITSVRPCLFLSLCTQFILPVWLSSCTVCQQVADCMKMPCTDMCLLASKTPSQCHSSCAVLPGSSASLLLSHCYCTQCCAMVCRTDTAICAHHRAYRCCRPRQGYGSISGPIPGCKRCSAAQPVISARTAGTGFQIRAGFTGVCP